MDKETLFKQITDYMDEHLTKVTYYSAISKVKPERGEIVLAYQFLGKAYCFDNQVARVLQIRTGCGQFGSDMYFLRFPDGSLITAENQGFRKVPEQFLEDVEKHFSTDLAFEQEGFDNGFSIQGEQLEVGFIVDGKNTQGTPDTPFAIAVTVEK